ncbi:kinase-like protein [Xylaria sp. CBS 124048]|nr:kinase-like protein [Xylaria sp. CBS 124048]
MSDKLKMEALAAAEVMKANAESIFGAAEYWEFEKCLGNGTYGMAVLMREKRKYVRRSRRMAVKVALHRDADLDLQCEVAWLKLLRGAKHIIKLLASREDVGSITQDTERTQRFMDLLKRAGDQHGSKLQRLPPNSVFMGLVGIHGPAMAMEHAEHGTLLDFKDKVERFNMRIPNRVLWSFFLCLIRACIGLAYPRTKPAGARAEVETIPEDQEPGDILHGDIALRNIMLAEVPEVGDCDEHIAAPILKLIDFGMASETGDNSAPGRNLYEIGHQMAYLASSLYFQEECVEYRGRTTQAGEVTPRLGPDNLTGLDVELRDLICQCMYTELEDRPSLQDALSIARDAVMNKTPDFFPSPELETDEAIQEFWQRSLYDADVEGVVVGFENQLRGLGGGEGGGEEWEVYDC